MRGILAGFLGSGLSASASAAENVAYLYDAIGRLNQGMRTGIVNNNVTIDVELETTGEQYAVKREVCEKRPLPKSYYWDCGGRFLPDRRFVIGTFISHRLKQRLGI